MKTTTAALAALLAAVPVAVFVTPVPAVASPFAEEGTPSLDDRFFKAYYQENGLRDFAKAGVLYGELADAARAAKDGAMETKALLGRARCFKVSGKRNEALEALKAALALEPENAEAKGLAAALEGKGKSAGGEDKELADRCEILLSWLAGMDTATARREFALLGARSLPYLEKALRYRSLIFVESSAKLLATGAIPGGFEALRRAIADPEVLYSRVVCDAVLAPEELSTEGRASRSEDIPLLEAVARREEPELRRGVVERLRSVDLGSDPRTVALIRALAADPDEGVRVAVLSPEWQGACRKLVSPFVTAALKSRSAPERAQAAATVREDPDLLRTAAGDLRELLKDPDASVRANAFETLSQVDGLAQADLSALLADSDGHVVADAAGRLREISPWEKGVGEAVRESLRKALRAEIPAEGIQGVLDFIGMDSRSGGLTAEDYESLFVQTWSPEMRLGSRKASTVRLAILDAANRFETPEAAYRCILRGLKAIPSPDGALQWIAYWTQSNSFYSPEIGMFAAASDDTRMRSAGYYCLVHSNPPPDRAAVSAALKHLNEDLMVGDPEIQGLAMGVATVYPDPVSVEAIRKHHASARGGERADLLRTLAQAAGKAAEPDVREDLGSKDLAVRSGAIWVLYRVLGIRDYADIHRFLEDGGQPREVAALWSPEYRPPLDHVRAFLKEVGPARADDQVIRVSGSLPVEERDAFLRSVLEAPGTGAKVFAAGVVASWRAMECVGSLSKLLDHPDPGVQAAAAKALEDLNKYLERKAAAARLLDGPKVDPLDVAREMLRDPDALKRRGAVLALGALQDKAAIPLLLKALEDKDGDVRNAALTVLERLGAPVK